LHVGHKIVNESTSVSGSRNEPQNCK